MEPEKEAGAGGKPTPKTNGSPRGYACCEHCSTRIELCPRGDVHYGKEICTDCDRVLRWVPRPENVARQQVNSLRLSKLARCECLTAWEAGFVRSVLQLARLSPRQQAVLERLAATYLKGRTT